MKKIVLITILAIFILGFFGNIDNIRAADADIVFVDDDYDETTSGWRIDHFSKIQDAINTSELGDTVHVYNGTYYENVYVNKSIVLVGEDRNNVIIDGGGNGNTVSIIINNVSISNFTIRNSGSELNNSGLEVLSDGNNIFYNVVCNNSVGICLSHCSDNIVKGNTVENNTYGVGIEYSNNGNNIFGNYVHNNNVTGIYLTNSFNTSIYNNSVGNNSYGIASSYSSNNLISENLIFNNTDDGLNGFFCNNTVFTKNILCDNECGIAFTASDNNSVGENYFYNNTICSIKLVIGSLKNEIYDNIISNCNNGIYISIDSFNTYLYNNMFSNTNQKIVDETIDEDNYSTPGFEIIIVFIAILMLFSVKEEKTN